MRSVSGTSYDRMGIHCVSIVLRRECRKHFMGCGIDVLTRRQTVQIVEEALKNEGGVLVHGVINAAKIVECYTNPDLSRAVNACSVVNSDGQSVVWFGRLAGVPIPERVTGVDLMEDLLDLANKRKLRIFLWGATPSALQLAINHIQVAYPDIGRIEGRDGYFDASEEQAICDEIASFHADIVFLGMSSPKKELLAFARGRDMRAKMVMGVGGAFDIWAGITKRAPKVWQVVGLEWMYRFLQEPRRLWRRYLYGNMRFLALWILWMCNNRPEVWPNTRNRST